MKVISSPAFSNRKANPYNYRLFENISKIGYTVDEYNHKNAFAHKYDIVHYHWPDGYINKDRYFKTIQRGFLLIFMVLLSRIKGSKIVWTVHNLNPHDAFYPKTCKLFLKFFVKITSGFIFMSTSGKNEFGKIYGLYKPYVIIPHGHYRNDYSKAIPVVQAREKLKIPAEDTVLLFFGMIKPYKNIIELIEVFNNSKLQNLTLLIVGQPDNPQLKKDILRKAEGKHKISLCLKFISDEEVSLYFSAADITVLPYTNILNSGVLLLSLSFDIPVIAPAVGAVQDLHDALGDEWIVTFNNKLTSHKLNQAIHKLVNSSRDLNCPLEEYDWENLAKETVSFYRQLCNKMHS